MFKGLIFSVLILLLIIIIIIAHQREEGDFHSFFFVLKWNRPENVSGQPQLQSGVQRDLVQMFDQNQKPKLSPHDVLPPEEPSCHVRIVQSYVANHGRILKRKKKKTGIFLLLFVALQCHVVATEAGRIHIDLGGGQVGWIEQVGLAGVMDE